MDNTINNYQLNQQLTIYSPSQLLLIVQLSCVTFIQQQEQIIECRLSLEVTPEIYQRIHKESLFNLKPEVRSPFSGHKFNAETDIQIEVTLQPNLLPKLLQKATNAQEVANYLINLSQQLLQTPETSLKKQDINSLLNTENWLALSVKQIQELGKVGYTTFWNYLNPSTINQPNATSDQIAEGIVNFVKEWTEANLAEATENATTEMLNSIGSVFRELVDETFTETEEEEESTSIFEAVVNFFEEDQWSFAEIEEKSSIRLVFRGEHGQYICYAQAREEGQQFVFYSVCPIQVPQEKRQAIAEFITRANYGMIIGNFELDFNDGEIRYKTSIDVEGDRLTSALIKQIVYANIIMMDEYLPGIVAVIENDVSPVDAIAQIEDIKTE